GKMNVQVVFWGFLVVLATLGIWTAEIEKSALSDPVKFVWMAFVLVAADLGLWAFNRRRAKLAVLYFEETAPELITTLGLVQPQLPLAKTVQGPSIL
ncbi:MAG: hypothetical protein WCA11_14840, partial [Terracidiphilus sp.]